MTLLQQATAAPDPLISVGIGMTVQLGAALLLVMLMVLIHAAGIIGTTKLLGLEDRALRAHRVDLRAFGLLISIALCLFVLHLAEIAVFAGFYRLVDAVPDAETALYYSASAFTTLGHPDVQFPREWRLVGAIEGLVGFLLIGWSTAVFIADMNKVLSEEERGDSRS